MKVHIAISTYRGFPQACIGPIRMAEECLRKSGVEVDPPDYYGSAMLADARNKVIAGRPPDADYTVFIDDDMVPEPMALVKLLQHDRKVITVPCTTRTPPLEICLKFWNEATQEFVGMDDIPRHRAFTVGNREAGADTEGAVATGCAFLAIRKDAIEELIENHLSAADWMDENRRMLDRLHVRAENREKERARIEMIRRTNWESQHCLKIFRFGKIDNEIDLGEDVTLGYRMKQCGIPVTVDPTIIVGHAGAYPYSMRDYLSSQDKRDIAEAQRIYAEEEVRRNSPIHVPPTPKIHLAS